MSVEAVIGRVSELQAMAGSAAHGSLSAAAGGFSAALSGASGAGLPVPATFSGLASPFATDPASTGIASQFATGAGPTFTGMASPYAAGMGPAFTGIASPFSAGSSLPADIPYGAEITAAAQRNGLDPALLAGLIKQESGFNPGAGSPAGAQGLTQLMPGTAAGLGVTNPFDPVQSIEGGARYLKQQLDAFGGDTARALAAYNAGPGAVQRFGGVPPYAETQNYVRSVQANAAALHSSPTTV